MSTTITFDQMERRADRALSVVLVAKHAKHWLAGVFWFYALNIAVKSLVKTTSRDTVNSLTDDEAKELADTLKDVLQNLNQILDDGNLCLIRRKRVFGWLIQKLEGLADDLNDIADGLVLSSNPEFRALVADCVASVSSARPVGLVGRM